MLVLTNEARICNSDCIYMFKEVEGRHQHRKCMSVRLPDFSFFFFLLFIIRAILESRYPVSLAAQCDLRIVILHKRIFSSNRTPRARLPIIECESDSIYCVVTSARGLHPIQFSQQTLFTSTAENSILAAGYTTPESVYIFATFD